MKRVLVVYYSQSGDVRRALEAVTAPLEGPDVEIHWERIETAPRYGFPWRAQEFFDCMPEAVNGEPPRLAPGGIDRSARYDLVIVGWQVWFLSPSLPIQAFLTAPESEVLRGARVIGVVCCRQMWQRAYAGFRRLVAAAGGHLTDNIVVPHQGNSSARYLTAPRLMLTGRRAEGAVLPAAGVAQRDIAGLVRFGQRLYDTRRLWADSDPEPLLTDLGPARVDPHALVTELIGIPFMLVLARVARVLGGPGSLARRPVVWLYVLLLVLLLPFVLPATALLTPVLRRVFASRLARHLHRVQG